VVRKESRGCERKTGGGRKWKFKERGRSTVLPSSKWERAASRIIKLGESDGHSRSRCKSVKGVDEKVNVGIVAVSKSREGEV